MIELGRLTKIALLAAGLALIPEKRHFSNQTDLNLLALNPARYEGEFVLTEGYYQPQSVYSERIVEINEQKYIRRYFINNLHSLPTELSPSIDVRWEDVYLEGAQEIPPLVPSSKDFKKVKVYGKVVNGTGLRDQPHYMLEAGLRTEAKS